MLVQVFKHSVDDGHATLHEVSGRTRIPAGVFEPVAGELVDAGYITEAEGHYRYTPKGAEAFSRLIGAARVWLLAQLADWHETENHGFTEAVDRLAERLVASGQDMSAGKHSARI
jgi:DNA-binding MarR family transcriptional regulator